MIEDLPLEARLRDFAMREQEEEATPRASPEASLRPDPTSETIIDPITELPPLVAGSKIPLEPSSKVLTEPLPTQTTLIQHDQVMYRRENVFSLIYQMSGYTQAMVVISDNYGNTILHLAGGLAPYDKLNLVLGATLQIQRELQWFKEVERLVAPRYKELPSKKDEIPPMVFTKEHKISKRRRKMDERHCKLRHNSINTHCHYSICKQQCYKWPPSFL
ncbi:hypothetical protein LOK49_LG08G00678 [Camellia lanceoleosa]|uniref:Uncharacterized protein n=1 Tax=Camellia lanceoleosa TaxID=1840588 RepID=A0ACC0GS40_9ERIC|nr:hypothetical protein LOK49_LG08G00678 [Camellia lanceoleosa]